MCKLPEAGKQLRQRIRGNPKNPATYELLYNFDVAQLTAYFVEYDDRALQYRMD
jgi:hypothetical protein